MRDTDELTRELERIDGRGYKAYLDIKGEWSFDDWTLEVAWVQGDPYATPSRIRVLIPAEVAGFPGELLASRSRRIGLACHLARSFHRATRVASSDRGTGRSGEIRMEDPGQRVFDQTAVQIDEDGSLEARFYVGLPARGRRVLGQQATELLTEDVYDLVESTLMGPVHDLDELRRAAETNEDADHLRGLLAEEELVAFVADGAHLPRRSGVDDRPLTGDAVVAFESPESLRIEVELPNRGLVTGMAVSRGVTLVVGGGFHGKSTLLRALEGGVWNHRPGDGRELVVSDPDIVKVRSEDGRSVAGVDISPFIYGLPGGIDTLAFTTPNASGSTSQAAGLVEAIEAGATAILVDEDTAATNFMIRDRRMQALVPEDAEPITPFVDRVRDLHEAYGISTVMVLGGSGDYLEVADTVIGMREYRPEDVTARAKEVAREFPTGRKTEAGRPLGEGADRVPLPSSVDPSKGRRSVRVKVRGTDRVSFGTEEIDLSAVEQVGSRAQLRSVTEALVLARKRFIDGERPLREILDAVMQRVEEDGLDALDARQPGDLAAFRRHELAAALNRLRTLEVG